MNERHLVLSLLMRDMGKSIDDLNEFEGRKYFQKIVYFAQLEPFGLDMGFGFSLHPHGPYSKELSECAKLIMQNTEDCKAFNRSHNFTSDAQSGIEKLQAFSKEKVDDLPELDFLEAAATLHFLWTSPFKHLPVQDRKAKVIDSCHQLKPRFAPATCQNIFTTIEKWNLLVA